MRAALRQHLTAAMRERDKLAVAALRTALAAIENAEAVVVAEGAPGAGAGIVTTSAHIAGAVAGVGGSEVARRELSDQEVADIVGNEIASLDSAAAEYERLGRPDHAGDLRHQAAVLRGHLGD